MKERASFSERVFARLVRLYPRAFREEFGAEMRQVFGEQIAEARERGWRAVGSLWVRTVVDGMGSLVREHVEASKGNMSNGVLYYFHQRFTFGRMFLVTTAALVALCVVGTLILLPKVYMSLARVDIRMQQGASYDPYQVQTAFERLKSQKVLFPVIEELNLTAVLAKQWGIAGDLGLGEAYRLLLPMLELRQSRSTSLVEIRVFSEEPQLGAAIANKIAEVAGRAEGGVLVDKAMVERRPVRPNVPLNLAVGGMLSVLVGLTVAGLGRLALWVVYRRA